MRKPFLFLCLVTGITSTTVYAQEQDGNPLLVSTEERCAFNRVDDESLELALEACRSAAENGDLQAQYEMGEFFYQGERVERDIEKALEWFERASIQGHPRAQYQLGLMHYQGEGVTRNLPQAYIILKMSAVNGEEAAMDASDRIALQMNENELSVATHVLGTLFRDYLTQLREEQLQQLQNQQPGPIGPSVPAVESPDP
ncbi:tetratricopeptide repeat protein [Halopseudomonas salina]|nr:tetratricopeptide repeat protein [Halopseudomonas salina]